MAQKRVRITRGQASRVRQLERELDDYTLRTLLTGGNQRLMRPERLANLKAGRGKLQPWERERIAQLQRNQSALGALKDKREDQPLYSARKKLLSSKYKERQTAKALRTWVLRGKVRDMPYDAQSMKTKRRQQSAIKALYWLGVDPTGPEGAPYYVRKEVA